jgi:hypothetical protein
MSEYNVSSIFEQMTTGSWVPENGEHTRVPRNGEPAQILGPQLFEDWVSEKRNLLGFRVPGS